MTSVRDYFTTTVHSARNAFYDFVGLGPEEDLAPSAPPLDSPEYVEGGYGGQTSELYYTDPNYDPAYDPSAQPRQRAGSVVDYSGFAAAEAPPSAPFAAPAAGGFTQQYQYQSLFQYQLDARENAIQEGVPDSEIGFHPMMDQGGYPQPDGGIPQPALPPESGNYPVIQLSPFNPHSGFPSTLYPPRPLGPFAMAAASIHMFGGWAGPERGTFPVPRGRGRGRRVETAEETDMEVPRYVSMMEDMTKTQCAQMEAAVMATQHKRKKSKNKSKKSKKTEEGEDDDVPEAAAEPPKKTRVCIVHRDGTKEIVDSDDPRVQKIRKNQSKKQASQAPAKPKNIVPAEQDYSKDVKLLHAQKDKAAAKALRPRPYFTITATILMIALFIVELIRTNEIGTINWSFSTLWSFGSVDTRVIVEMGGKYGRLIADDGQWWRFFTPIFLHCSVVHIVFNLLMQIKIGADMERSFGTLRFSILFILCGLGGNLLSSCFLFTQIQAGASGSLFGLLGLMLIDVIVHWHVIRKPAISLIIIIITIIISVISGMMPGTDNFAHVGGLIFGIVGGFAFLPSLVTSKNNKNSKKRANVTRCCVVFITFPLLIAMTAVLFYLFYGIVAKGHNIDCKWCQEINCASALFGKSYCQGN